MGREAVVQAQVGNEAGEVKALLESSELILRGPIRRRFSRPSLEHVRVEGGALCFRCAGEAVRLDLGPHVAEAWRRAIATPPPSLRAKLGLDGRALALLVGSFDDAALAQALDGVLTNAPAEASMIVACVAGAADLEAARTAQARRPELPIWTVCAKGKGVAFGDNDIRLVMRGAGFRDTKSCAVSERLTATRYNTRGH